MSLRAMGTISTPQRSSSSPSLQITVQKAPGRVLTWPMRAPRNAVAAAAAPRKVLTPRSNTALSAAELTM